MTTAPCNPGTEMLAANRRVCSDDSLVRESKLTASARRAIIHLCDEADAREFVDSYLDRARTPLTTAALLGRPHRVDYAAAEYLIETMYPQLWDMVARSSHDSKILDRLADAGEPTVDLSLAMLRAADLHGKQARGVASRVAAKAADIHKRLATVALDVRERSALVAQLNSLQAAGNSLLTNGPNVDAVAVDLLRSCCPTDVFERWLHGSLASQPTNALVVSFVKDPGQCFGSTASEVGVDMPAAMRKNVLGLAIVSNHQHVVERSLLSPCADAFADSLGPALLAAGERNRTFRDYIHNRLLRELDGDNRLAQLALAHSGGWSDDLGSLVDVFAAIKRDA